jgi:hypothetical protein
MRTAWISCTTLVVALFVLVLPTAAFAAGGCSCTAAAPSEPSLTHRSHSYPPAGAIHSPMRRGASSSGFGDAGRKVRGQY